MRDDQLLNSTRGELATEYSKDELADGIFSLRRQMERQRGALEEVQNSLVKAKDLTSDKFSPGRRAMTDLGGPLIVGGAGELINMLVMWIGKPGMDGNQGAVSRFVAKWTPLFRSLPHVVIGLIMGAMTVPTAKSGVARDGAYEGSKTLLTGGLVRLLDYLSVGRAQKATDAKEAAAKLAALDAQLRQAQSELAKYAKGPANGNGNGNGNGK